MNLRVIELYRFSSALGFLHPRFLELYHLASSCT
jgi:hypothetical protein